MTIPPERMSRRVLGARFNRRPMSLRATLIALAVVLALGWTLFIRQDSSETAPTVQGIQGSYTWEPDPGSIGLQGRFGAVASGDAGGDSSPDGVSLGMTPSQSAYRAGTRTETTVAGPGAPSGRRTIGVWPPAWLVATHSPLDYQGLAAIVRTAVEEGDEAAVGLKPVKDGERAAWRAAMRLDDRQISLVVDQQTGIVTWYSDGEATFTAEVDWASPPPAGTSWTVEVPAGMPVKTERADGFTYAASPADVSRTAGYPPLVSDLAPDGYELKAVATIIDGYRPMGWVGIGPSAPPTAPPLPVVLQLHTRGLSAFTLEQIGPPRTREYVRVLKEWLDQSSREYLSSQETTLQFGCFKGETALTWYQESGPSLFVGGARRAVFVTGALTRQELIAFAEGLEPVAAAR